MDSIGTKIGIFLLGVSVSNIMPSGFEKILIFLIGILLTLAIECFLVYHYILHKSSPYTEVSFAKKEIKANAEESTLNNRQTRQSQVFARSPRKTLTKFSLERRLTMIQCPCTEEKFQTLVLGNEKVFADLLGHIKELINSHKRFGAGLVKLGEIGLIEKLKSKKSMELWKNFRKYLLEIGENFLKETENFNDTLVGKILAIEKEITKQYKELSQNLRNCGENFYKLTAESEKLMKKLQSLQKSHRKANSEFKDAKNDLAQFETLVKKEMKLKKINNDVAVLKGQIKNFTELTSEEVTGYLPKATEIVREASKLDVVCSEHYRNFIKQWLELLLNHYLLSAENISKIENSFEESKSEKLTGLNKTVNFLKSTLKNEKIHEQFKLKKLFSSFTKETPASDLKKLEKKLEKIGEYGNDMLKFLNFLVSNEEDHFTEILRILSSWHNIKNFQLEAQLGQIKSQLLNLFTNAKSYKQEILIPIGKCKELNEVVGKFCADVLSQLDPSKIQSIRSQIMDFKLKYESLIMEAKEKVFQSFHEKFLKCANELKSCLEYLQEDTDYLGNNEEFSHNAKSHRIQCPFFLPALQNEDFEIHSIEEPIKCGTSESALWLNDLLSTFLSEWRVSPKFNDYIRAKLKKIYNKDNPSYIGVIEICDVEIGDQAPEVKEFTRLETENDNEFYYDFDLWFRGDVKIHLEFPLKFSVAEMNVSVKVVLRSFYGKFRLFYTPSRSGSSWYSFVSEPVHQITLEPVLGKMSKIALSKVPQLNSVLVSRLSKKIRKYVWPNRRAIKIFKGMKSEIPLN